MGRVIKKLKTITDEGVEVTEIRPLTRYEPNFPVWPPGVVGSPFRAFTLAVGSSRPSVNNKF